MNFSKVSIVYLLVTLSAMSCAVAMEVQPFISNNKNPLAVKPQKQEHGRWIRVVRCEGCTDKACYCGYTPCQKKNQQYQMQTTYVNEDSSPRYCDIWSPAGQFDKYDVPVGFIEQLIGSKEDNVNEITALVDLIATCAEVPDIFLRNNTDADEDELDILLGNNVDTETQRVSALSSVLANVAKLSRPGMNVVRHSDIHDVSKAFKKSGCAAPLMLAAHAFDAVLSSKQLLSKQPFKRYSDRVRTAMITLIVMELVIRTSTYVSARYPYIFYLDKTGELCADALNLIRLIIKHLPDKRVARVVAIEEQEQH